ncbi:MAG TPA: methyl-accepting chemotaxis protein [Desulfomicrobiaceae bacterium]|nr:methyl-accepting chemotaxis protein [Desulfomicrobiaceae bacterium]
MRIKDMSVKYKIGVSVCVAVFMVLVPYTLFVVWKTEDIAIKSAREISEEMAGRYGKEVQGKIEKALDASAALGAAFQGMVTRRDLVERGVVDEMQKEVLVSDPAFYGIQSCFEPDALDDRDAEFAARDDYWKHMNGAYGNYWWKEDGTLKVQNLAQYDYTRNRGWYMEPRDTGKPLLTEPYKSVTGVVMSTVSVPVRDNGTFIGIVGIDFSLAAFQDMVSGITPMETGYAFIASNKGYTVAHPDKGLIGKDIAEGFAADRKRAIMEAVAKGREYGAFMPSTADGLDYYVLFQPVTVQGTATPWSMGIAVPKDRIYEAANEFLLMSVLLLIAALVTVGVVVFLVARVITRPLVQGAAFAEQIAAGDLSARITLDRKDEIGTLAAALDRMADGLQKNADLAETIASGNLDVEVQLASDKDQFGRVLQKMTGSLNSVLGQVQMAGEQIATGSVQVSDASQSLSQGATEAASSLEEITSSMGEMASQTKLNADNASQASSLAAEAKNSAETGSNRMKQMISAMAEINESGQSISKIIKAIDEIAFQTNLLALNAAVEAARAGQHGKGFAVVAEEVRNLAARSAKAATETSDLIEGSVKKAENGAEIADKTAEALAEIVDRVSRVTDLVNEIAAASTEQAHGIGEVNQGLGQIDQVTQSNTANAEQSAAAAEELASQATELKRLLAHFRIKGGVSSSGSGRSVQAGRALGQARTRPAPRAPRSAPSGPDSGWGGTPAHGGEAKVSRPEDLIALDDDEFGKY